MCARVAKTGRRAGLKILWRVTFRVGSTPTPGTLESWFPSLTGALWVPRVRNALWQVGPNFFPRGGFEQPPRSYYV